MVGGARPKSLTWSFSVLLPRSLRSPSKALKKLTLQLQLHSTTDFLLKELVQLQSQVPASRASSSGPQPPSHPVPTPSPQTLTRGAGDHWLHSLQEQKPSFSKQVSLTKLHPLGLPTNIHYQVLIQSPILITKPNDQVLLLAIYMHDILSPLPPPHNPHFRKAKHRKSFQRGQCQSGFLVLPMGWPAKRLDCELLELAELFITGKFCLCRRKTNPYENCPPP